LNLLLTEGCMAGFGGGAAVRTTNKSSWRKSLPPDVLCCGDLCAGVQSLRPKGCFWDSCNKYDAVSVSICEENA